MKKFIGILSIFCLLACQVDDEPQWVAKYNNYILTQSEVQSVIPSELSEEDSIQFVNDYVERWVKDKVLMNEKDSFLTEEEISKIEAQVENYREDLMEITIEDKLTLGFSNEVSEDELREYYDKYPDTFVLKDNILSYKFMQVPEDSVGTYKRLLRNEDYENLKQKLDTYDYYYDFTPNNWIELDKLLKADVLPEKIKKQRLMSGNQIYTATDNGNSFILEVVEVAREGSRAPFTYIKPTIKSVVLNKRKLNLLSQKKKELYEKALENDEIKRN